MNFKKICLVVSLMGIMPLEASFRRAVTRGFDAATDVASYAATAASRLSARPTINATPARSYIPASYRTHLPAHTPNESDRVFRLVPDKKPVRSPVGKIELKTTVEQRSKAAITALNSGTSTLDSVLSHTFTPSAAPKDKDSKKAAEPQRATSEKSATPEKTTQKAEKPKENNKAKSLSEYVAFEQWEDPNAHTASSEKPDTVKVEVVQSKHKKQRSKMTAPRASLPRAMGSPAVARPLRRNAIVVEPTAAPIQPRVVQAVQPQAQPVLAIEPAIAPLQITPLNRVTPFAMPTPPILMTEIPTWARRVAPRAPESSMALVPVRATAPRVYSLNVPTEPKRAFSTVAAEPRIPYVGTPAASSSRSQKNHNRGYSWHNKALIAGAGAAALALMATHGSDSKEKKEVTELNAGTLIDQKALCDVFKTYQEILAILANPSRFDKATLDAALARLAHMSEQAKKLGYRIKLIETGLLPQDMQTDDADAVSVLRFNQNTLALLRQASYAKATEPKGFDLSAVASAQAEEQALSDGNDTQLALSQDNTGEIGVIISGKKITLPAGIDANGQPVIRDFYLALESNRLQNNPAELAITDHQQKPIVQVVLDPKTRGLLTAPAVQNKTTAENQTSRTLPAPAAAFDYSSIPALVASTSFVDAPMATPDHSFAPQTNVPDMVNPYGSSAETDHSEAYNDLKEDAERLASPRDRIRAGFPAVGLHLAQQRNNQNDQIEFPDLADDENASQRFAHNNPVREAIREYGDDILNALRNNSPMQNKWARGCTELIEFFKAYNTIYDYWMAHPRRGQKYLIQCRNNIDWIVDSVRQLL